jgi:dihydropyrimidinase
MMNMTLLSQTASLYVWPFTQSALLLTTGNPKVTANEVLPGGLDIGIRDGKIAALGYNFAAQSNAEVIDAQGAYVTPGGIDSHTHIQQDNQPTGDTWETASRSAIAGGTTTVLAFVTQKRHNTSVLEPVQQYHTKADGQVYCDYGFHLILTNPTEEILRDELPKLVDEGITSVKLYMTYEPYKLGDRQLLDVMLACRALGMTTMIHAENSDMIAMVIERLERRGNTDPFFHAIARPRLAEDEATYRAISLAELVDAPILMVHMSSVAAVEHVRAAQARLLPVHAETCPHYLFLLSDEIRQCHHGDDFHGAKFICAPPLRHHESDLEGLWRGLANGSFTVWSSDHAPSKYDHPQGKKAGIKDGVARFSKVPNGLPGLETRMALLFNQSEGCLAPEKARITLPQFVRLTASNAAKLYGMDDRKGTLMVGYDADLVIWYPPGDARGNVTIAQEQLHHGVDYTPFEGMSVQNWPRYTILRGKVVWQHDGAGIVGEMGYGKFLRRNKGKLVTGKMGQRGRGMLPGERELWL